MLLKIVLSLIVTGLGVLVVMTPDIARDKQEAKMITQVQKSFCKSNEKLEAWYFQPSDKENTTEKKWRCVPQVLSQGMP